jgi:hypothetical protein
MVSDPLNFKNPPAKSRARTAKPRKYFAKKILSKRPNPGVSGAFSEMVAKPAQLG